MLPAKKILLVAQDNDDTAVFRYVLRNSAPTDHTCYYDVTSVASARQALCRLITQWFDIMLVLSPCEGLRGLQQRAKLINKWMPILRIGRVCRPSNKEILETAAALLKKPKGPLKGSPGAMKISDIMKLNYSGMRGRNNMVGGRVINVLQTEPGIKWVQCADRTYADDVCAIRVRTEEPVKVGDAIWWQGNRAMWTPKPDDGREDIPLERVGYSHSNIPQDVMEKLA